jgi:hypothetical protein
MPAFVSRRRHDRLDLQRIADRAMRERGLEPEVPRDVLAEVDALRGPAADPAARDLRELLCCSIDDDDSLDLDQGVTAQFIDGCGFPSLRRVLRSPERWARIVALARELGAKLPAEPDSAALERSCCSASKPIRFASPISRSPSSS